MSLFTAHCPHPHTLYTITTCKWTWGKVFRHTNGNLYNKNREKNHILMLRCVVMMKFRQCIPYNTLALCQWTGSIQFLCFQPLPSAKHSFFIVFVKIFSFDSYLMRTQNAWNFSTTINVHVFVSWHNSGTSWRVNTGYHNTIA